MNGNEISQHELRYDKIIRDTFARNDEITINFINRLFGDSIPLDTPVEWPEKESADDWQTAITADFYLMIDGKVCAFETEQYKNGDIDVRVCMYAKSDKRPHGSVLTKAELNISFSDPCIIETPER